MSKINALIKAEGLIDEHGTHKERIKLVFDSYILSQESQINSYKIKAESFNVINVGKKEGLSLDSFFSCFEYIEKYEANIKKAKAYYKELFDEEYK